MLSGFPKNESIGWLDFGDQEVASFRRSRSGSISPIITWPDFDDPQVAPFRRSRSGTISPINNKKSIFKEQSYSNERFWVFFFDNLNGF